MPNELRPPENRFNDDVSFLAVRIIDMHYWLSSESILHRGLKDQVFKAFWPDQTELELELMLKMIELIDITLKEDANPVKKLSQGESQIVGSKIMISDDDVDKDDF